MEFGGTQLYLPPASNDKPPQTQIALQFQQPTSISFLTRGASTEDFAWSQQLHDDQLESLTCSYGEFAFGGDDALTSLLQEALHVNTIHGYAPATDNFLRELYHLVFWCGDYGFAVAARNLRPLTQRRNVPLN